MRKYVEIFSSDVLRPLRFLIIGGAATAMHLIVAASLFSLHFGASPYLVNLIAFLVAFVVSFYGHRHVTFKTHGSMRRFLVVAIGGFFVNNLILMLCLKLSLGEMLSVAIATLCVPVLTYLASSLWAFKTEEK